MSRPSAGLVKPGDLVRDGRLPDAQGDRLDHAAIARIVAEVALAAEPPVNIALFGPYGAGKSSIYSMVQEHIGTINKSVDVVRYDAWKYGGKYLKRNFIASLAADLRIDDPQFGDHLYRNDEQVKMRLAKWLRGNWGSLSLGLVIAVLCALVVVMVGVAARLVLTDAPWETAVIASGPSALPVFGLVFAALVIGQRALEGVVEKIIVAPPEGDDQFSEKFNELLRKVKATRDRPLVVFIDELDRCADEDVVSTLVDLKTFLDQKGCVFIVAVDRDVVEQALNKVPQSKPVRGADPYYATRGAFLDKIFQHQISLPPLRPKVLTRLAHDLVAEAQGLWKELRDHGQQTFDNVVFALVPAHLTSPRRVKVLLNAYATTVRIAQERGIDWLDRAPELAVMTVIQTEFPAVAADLVRAPRLLSAIRGGLDDPSKDLQMLAARYQIEPASTSRELPKVNPAGELLTGDDRDDDEEVDVATARETSARHLSDYLAKIAAAGLADPRPDLYYLQLAGLAEGLIEKRHSDAIDQATNTAPGRTVAMFEDEPSETLLVAANLLVAEGERDFGPGRWFAYEAACLLVERMDPVDVARLDGAVRGAILAAASESGWPLEATPGALLLASEIGQDRSAKPLLRRLQDPEVGEDLLTRASKVLRIDSGEVAHELASILADNYVDSPEPLHSALTSLPSGPAGSLWEMVSGDIIDAITELELPEADDGSRSAPVPRTGRAVAPTAPAPAPAPTGDGCRRLAALVESLLARSDGEDLLSSVFQRSLEFTIEPLRDQVRDLASEVFGVIEDDSLVNLCVFTALRTSEPADWQHWTGLLRAASSSADVTRAAGEFVTERLLPQIEEQPVDRLWIQRQSNAVAPHCIGPDVIESILSNLKNTMEKVRWNTDPQDLGWVDSRAAAWDIVEALGAVIGPAAVDQLLVDDAYAPVATMQLEEVVVDELLSRFDALKHGPASAVSRALDEYQVREGEELAILRLKLRARSRCDGRPLDASDLAHINDSPGATRAFEDWLSVGPSGEAVASLVHLASPARPTLSDWAKHATDADRTRVWIALEATHATTRLLSAAGQYGVNADVIAHVAQRVRACSNQAERNDAIDVLESARLSTARGSRINGARRAASDLAEGLLGSGYQGDARLALRVVTWAGGPGQGHVTVLRNLFTEAHERNSGLFGREQKKQLESFNMLTKRRIVDALRGK